MPVTVYPKGTTIYCPEKCCNGYTVVQVRGAKGVDVALIDMNGGVVRRWAMDSLHWKGKGYR